MAVSMDMYLEWKQWRHVFKLDPNKELSDQALEQLCESGTDAVLVGGSSGVTFDNTVELLARIRQYAVPCVLEISSPEAVVPGFDYYFIPMVLNADHPQWLIGMQTTAIREYSSMMDWREIVGEGYIILNPASTAAQVTGAKPIEQLSELLAYVHWADKLCRLPIIYIEYSGAFGEMDWVQAALRSSTQAHLIYGGGVVDAATASAAARCANTVVVGNVIYAQLEQALETVHAVKAVSLT